VLKFWRHEELTREQKLLAKLEQLFRIGRGTAIIVRVGELRPKDPLGV
jgi:hypothetical protein